MKVQVVEWLVPILWGQGRAIPPVPGEDTPWTLEVLRCEGRGAMTAFLVHETWCSHTVCLGQAAPAATTCHPVGLVILSACYRKRNIHKVMAVSQALMLR